ncbi:MAG: hypothetical protein IKP54_10410 [Bacteroidales bacterium]|nr:hypothetical protein [Bacteroidales bacterium]
MRAVSISRDCETQSPTLTFHLLPSTNSPFLATARRVANIDLPSSTFHQFSVSRNCETQLPTLTSHILSY